MLTTIGVGVGMRPAERKLLSGASLGVLLFLLFGSHVYSQSSIATVTGHGSSVYEAREDAIRQALQQVVKQLVVAERVVQDDQLVLDRLASTMNGYVSRFTTLNVTTVDGTISVDAVIEVSETRIENFLDLTAAGKTEIDIGNIVAAAQQHSLARQASTEILKGLLGPFPIGALEAEAPSIEIDERNPSIVNVEFDAWISPVYLRRLKQGLKTIVEIGGGEGPFANSVERARNASGSASESSPEITVCFVKAGKGGRNGVDGCGCEVDPRLPRVESDPAVVGHHVAMYSKPEGLAVSWLRSECFRLSPVDISEFQHTFGRLVGLSGVLVLESSDRHLVLKSSTTRLPILMSAGGQGRWGVRFVFMEGKRTIRKRFSIDQFDLQSAPEQAELKALPLPVRALARVDDLTSSIHDVQYPAIWSIAPEATSTVPLTDDDINQMLALHFVSTQDTAKGNQKKSRRKP